MRFVCLQLRLSKPLVNFLSDINYSWNDMKYLISIENINRYDQLRASLCVKYRIISQFLPYGKVVEQQVNCNVKFKIVWVMNSVSWIHIEFKNQIAWNWSISIVTLLLFTFCFGWNYVKRKFNMCSSNCLLSKWFQRESPS